MSDAFTLNPGQARALTVLGGPAKHVLLKGGSRSGKTFLILRAIALRAMAAPYSRHAVFRLRFNAVKTSIVLDTWPKMMRLCYPEVEAPVDRTDYFARMPNGAEVWFGGLDDKERTEKILGQEYATLFLNEISQIPYESRNIALTRLAQKAEHSVRGAPELLRLRAYYDCNPPSTAHWCYRLFHLGRDPESGKPIDTNQYAHCDVSPRDNVQNLAPDYIQQLESLPARLRERFLEGRYTNAADNALWLIETLDRSRWDDVPEMQRIIVAVDPSGAGDQDNTNNDAIGIVVAGLGADGHAYLLEDLTLKAGPGTWGKVVASAFDRWKADRVVAEKNFGGEMVRHVIMTARPNTPVRLVTASRGKTVRAEPIAALHEQGKIRLAGRFDSLEDELTAFTTTGYAGSGSPNRADAFVWAMSELFPGIVKPEAKPAAKRAEPAFHYSGAGSWMG